MTSWSALQGSNTVDVEQTNFVLISVDGDRDTPDVMKAYLENFPGQFIGLTASPTKVKALAKQFSAAFFKGAPSAHDGHYDVSHSSQAFLLDANGSLRAELFSPTTEAMAGTLNALLEEVTGPGSTAD
jgi:protein SCO1/2